MLPGLNPASSRLYHQDHSQRNRMAKTSVRHSTLQQCSNNNFEIFVVAHNSFVNFNDTLNMGAPKCGGPPNVGGPGHVPLLPRPKSATGGPTFVYIVQSCHNDHKLVKLVYTQGRL